MSRDRDDDTEKKSNSPHAAVSEDRRASEYLANERTFLAWVRTSIALISLGFVVAKFTVWLRELAARLNPNLPGVQMGASLPIGLALMALGGLLGTLAARRYWAVNRKIARGQVTADHGLVILVTVLVLLLALAMIADMLVTAERP